MERILAGSGPERFSIASSVRDSGVQGALYLPKGRSYSISYPERFRRVSVVGQEAYCGDSRRRTGRRDAPRTESGSISGRFKRLEVFPYCVDF